jgi:hypothetical protein
MSPVIYVKMFRASGVYICILATEQFTFQAPPTPISAMWPRTHTVLPKVRALIEELKKELPARLSIAQRSSVAR